MFLTVLVDNNTIIDEYYIGEPGLSFYIEDEDIKILFDCGYSNVFIENMKKLNLSTYNIDVLAISHGHDDHVGGIKYLAQEKLNPSLKIIGHSLAFNKKIKNNQCISSPLDINGMKNMGEVQLSKGPIKISENIYFLGEIPSTMGFEPRHSIGEIEIDNKYEKDFIYDDTALVYKGKEGLFIITGCSHSGICNIVEYAKKVCNENSVIGIIGGTHLREYNDRANKTLEYFKDNNINKLYLGHCTSFEVKSYIHSSIPITEVGVGLKLEIN
ncbi:MBL fold metallo-hydrolase [Terrisporobacter mayombei]|uniref:Metallo-beta-lactamase domain-containing protein n=1 Tax=Terrisporobacter mayombei TaxID=1541 RepID=A0ABY9PZ23_9FIRM|nr:MBL fold metallo-hydrolase [Terrisporobacter mayombei]MCC3868432.1 MBL fold metallo-hydrolase [Terrisporobacter mayombei]WMT80581.1 hypothetical protein TEMA_09020 [Terrisporobacter mayombei]